VRDILETLERWTGEGLLVATATVVSTERSAPKDPGAVLAVSEKGEVAGSVTGGCVEPALYEEARSVLAGAPPRLVTYGIADDEAFEVGLPCGGTVHIFVDALDPALVAPIAEAVRTERPVALAVRVTGSAIGQKQLVYADGSPDGELARKARALLSRGETGFLTIDQDEVFVSSFVPRPRMYVFGAIDFASALASIGRFLGYRVTVCDARAKFVTPERFPDVDELVVEWPDRFLASAPVDARTAICVLTHDDKFDLPILKAALAGPAGYIGAMGSRRTTERRAERLRAEGVTDEELARVHAPTGLKIGSRSPEEVAVAIAAEIISVFNAKAASSTRSKAASSSGGKSS
jgi:xanthine dehydrogenase accessory factor